MDGYVGVKFRGVQRSMTIPINGEDSYPAFRRTCNRLREHHMTPANGGNVSMRYHGGFLISAAGCNLGCVEQDELILVEHFDVAAETVTYLGAMEPSSESIMHGLIYAERPEAGAVIHAHDEFATRPELVSGELEETEREAPYGTVELARMAIKAFQRAERIIILKNHGYVAIGPDLETTCDLVVNTHLRLLKKHKP